jgi:hypothetical protein
VDGKLEQKLIKAGKKVLTLVRQGKTLIFPDVLKIEKVLLTKHQDFDVFVKSGLAL